MTDDLVVLFAWQCEACGREQEYETVERYLPSDGWPKVVKCERCGIAHRVEYDYATDTGPSTQVFMIEGDAA